jgi:hypothetical protein
MIKMINDIDHNNDKGDDYENIDNNCDILSLEI